MKTRGKGRPTKFTDTTKNVALALAERGTIDSEIAKILNISESTFHLWKKEYPEFSDSLRKAKDCFDIEQVENSLLKRALGMVVKEVQEKEIEGRVTRTVIQKELPPDTTALALYLRNRMPEKWCREKQVIEQKNSYDIQIGLTSEELRRIIKEDPINQDIVVVPEFLELDIK